MWNHLSYARFATLVKKTEEREIFEARNDFLGQGLAKVACWVQEKVVNTIDRHVSMDMSSIISIIT